MSIGICDSREGYGWLSRDVVARHAAARPGRLAVSDLTTGQKLTFRELETEIQRCTHMLRAHVSTGGRVAILGRNSIRHVALFYACPRAGAVFQPLNWRLSGAEIAGLLQDAEPDLFIYDVEFEAAAQAALAQAPVRTVLQVGRAVDEFALAVDAAVPVEPLLIDPSAPSMLLYTSGTTGRPKGVIVTPKSAFHAAMNQTYVAELAAEHAQLCDVPLFHVVGLLAILHTSLLTGAAVHLSDRFTPAATAARLQDAALGVTHYFCVPQMAQALLDDPSAGPESLAGVRFFTGGAPMPEALTERLLMAGAAPANGYGMSEVGAILGMPLDRDIAQAKAGSAGVPAPAIEIRIVGADGRDVPDGEVGEILLRGPSVTIGYWNNPEATKAAFSDGWLRTGDAGRRDADGFYFIVDRWKDMYISGGENVYPAEVEAVLAAMDGVAEAAVVGVPDTRWGESGCAFVVAKPGVSLQAVQVTAWCGERLARYKSPAHVRFVEALPRTGSGKVQKDALRRAFAEARSDLQS